MTIKELFTPSDMTVGKPWEKIVIFTIPMLIGNIAQQLYNTVDSIVIGKYVGDNALAAVGSASPILNLLLVLFVGISVGAGVMVSQYFGARQREELSMTIGNCVTLTAISSLIIMFLGAVLSRPLLELLNTPDSIIDWCTSYLVILMVGCIGCAYYNILCGILRGLGDSISALIYLLVATVLNIILDIVFVSRFQMGVAGVAYATVISEACSALFVTLFLVFNHKGFVRLNLHELIPQKDVLLEILKIGIPSGLQGLGFGIPNVLIQSSLYSIHGLTLAGQLISDDEIVAGSAAANTIENYVFAITDSCAAACISFVGQNFGAKKEENVKKVFWYSQIWMAIFTSIAVCIARGCSEPLLKIFLTKTQDGEVVNQEHAILAGQERRKIVITREVLNGIRDVDSNYLRGRKHSLAPALIILFGATGSRILFLYTIFPMETFHTRIWLYATFPISWILIDLIYIPIILHLQKKSFAKFHETEALPSAKNN